MKKIIRNSFISFVSVLGVVALYRKHLLKKGPLVRVLCLHDVPDKKWFSETVTYITEKYNVVSPEEFLNQKFNTKKINILFTFDDGYQSWIDVVLPVFDQLSIKAVFFINSGLVDVHDDTEKQKVFVKEGLQLSKPRETISWEGLRALKKAGHIIGGHSKSHVPLSELNSEELRKEIHEDKQKIESQINDNISVFAYPFGRKSDYNEEVKDVVMAAGYKAAFSTHSRFVNQNKTSLYNIPRLCLEENLSVKEISNWIEGGYDILKYSKIW